MQQHRLAARPGGVRGKSRQDKIAAQDLLHYRHNFRLLRGLLEDLALVDQVEDALVGAFGFQKADAGGALER